MFHGLNNQFLYSAYKIDVIFVDDIGNIKTGTGTCFFVMNKNNKLCLITNRHVFDISYKRNGVKTLKKYSLKEVKISGKCSNSNDNFPDRDLSFFVAPIVSFPKNINDDIACIANIQILSANEGSVLINYFIPYSFLATEFDFQDRLMVCDFLAFPGFPEWHDKKENRPILRTGTISSDPRFNYSYNDSVEGACVAFEAFSSSGSSGSPVFAVQKGPKPGPGIEFAGFRSLLLVGINAGHLKTSEMTHSGISYFYKSTVIAEMID
jgi:hypothetical protein